MTCDQVREAAAVRLLTGGPPDPEVEAHVDGCEGCRSELEMLAPMPALLSAGRPAVEMMDEPAPSDALLERLLSAAAAERRRRRVRTTFAAVAAVAAVALVAVPVAVAASHRDDTAVVGSAGAHVQAQGSNQASGVSGQVTLARSSWGSSVVLQASGVQAGTSCTVVVVTRDGSRQTAATWWAQEYPGPATVEGTVAADLPSIAHVDLIDTASGRVLLALPVTA